MAQDPTRNILNAAIPAPAEDLRTRIEGALVAGDEVGARLLLGEYWRSDRSPARAQFVLRTQERFASKAHMQPFRIALFRSFTIEPIEPILKAAAWSGGLKLDVKLSGFNTYMQEAMDPQGILSVFRPDAAILAVQTSDIAPELWSGGGLPGQASRQTAIDRVVAHFDSFVRAFRRQTAASLVIHNLQQPAVPTAGVLDAQLKDGQRTAIQEINGHLLELARAQRGVYILDYDALVSRHGRDHWSDVRKWLTMRLPLAAPYLTALADEWLRFLHPLAGRVAKALVVDLDNTLWGGVVGEDGVEGLALDGEYPGAAYLAVQRALLDLHARGVLLAIASKNNPEDAWKAISTHPNMLLRREHFVAHRIGWGSKAGSLREIAAELNIGTDALAFLDDNPVERRHIRMELPEVAVLEPGDGPFAFAPAIHDFAPLQRLQLSEEDLQRTRYYLEQQQRGALVAQSQSPEDFLASLRQEIEIRPVTAATLARVAQLTQKTNQFNVTTRRYGEEQVAAFAARDDTEVFSARVIDAFGDNGITAVAILRYTDTGAEIDTFLLSCRVIGRSVETALLSFLCSRARERGARVLVGSFVPSSKNAPASDFFKRHGFVPTGAAGGGTLFELLLDTQEVKWPPCITAK